MSNDGIVFKQWYKSVNFPSTTVLNQKHLYYIATRKGCVYNKDCGFGLFGKLLGMDGCRDINHLQRAQELICSTSKEKTVYRAVFSLGHEVAMEKGYYSREKWKDLLSRKIPVLAKEMGIEEKEFMWCSAFHFEKGHPHCHVMYYDNSIKVRQEFIPKERFEILAEKVRGQMNGVVFGQEIKKERKNQQEQEKNIRLELLSLFRDLNPKEPLPLRYVSKGNLINIGKMIEAIAGMLPKTGSLKFEYLDPLQKQMIREFSKEVLTLAPFETLLKDYITSTCNVSRLYGNTESTQAFQTEQAEKNLYKEMGNILLKFTKANYELGENLNPQHLKETVELFEETVQETLKEDFAVQEAYEELKDLFPKRRTPISEFADDAFNEKVHDVVTTVLKSKGVKQIINEGILIKKNLEEDIHEDTKEDVDVNYSYFYKTTRKLVMDEIFEEKGYHTQFRQALAMSFLTQLFGTVSQSTNHNKNIVMHNLHQRASLSKTAKKNIRTIKRQGGDWESEWGR